MHVQTAFRSRASGLLPFSVLFAGRSFCRAVGSLLDLRDRGFSHRDPAVFVVAEFNDAVILGYGDNDSVKAAGRNDDVPYFHLGKHGAQPFLFLLLRPDREEIHGAKWRKEFGGQIYKKDGSHGCVNVQVEIMGELYELTELGTLVLVKK